MFGLERFFGTGVRSVAAERLPSAEIVKAEGYSPEFVEAKSREVNKVLIAIQESSRVLCENCPSARGELSVVTDALFNDVRGVLRQLKENPGNFGQSLFLLKALEAGASMFDLVATKSAQPLSHESRNELVRGLLKGIEPLIEGFADLSQNGREVVDNIRLQALLGTIREMSAVR